MIPALDPDLESDFQFFLQFLILIQTNNKWNRNTSSRNASVQEATNDDSPNSACSIFCTMYVNNCISSSRTVHPAYEVNGYKAIPLIWPIIWWSKLRPSIAIMIESTAVNMVNFHWTKPLSL